MNTPLDDGLNWEALPPVIITAEPAGTKLGHKPIPTQHYPIMNTDVVAVEMRSEGAKPHWWLAGSVNRTVDTNLAPEVILQPLTVSQQRKIELGERTLVAFPNDGASLWTLEVNTAYYLPDISIYIWIYKGDLVFDAPLENTWGWARVPAGTAPDRSQTLILD